MMKKLQFITIVLIVSGFFITHQTAAFIGFEPEKEYHYDYEGRVRFSLPNVANDKAAVDLKAEVIIQTDANNLLVQLDEISIFSGKVGAIEQKSHDYQKLTQPELTLPFRILYDDNTSELKGVETHAKDSLWSIGIKTALAALLQIYTFKNATTYQQLLHHPPVETNEMGTEGTCPTTYVYSGAAHPENPSINKLKIFKTRDTTNCHHRPVWRKYLIKKNRCGECKAATERNHGSASEYYFHEENGHYTLQKIHFKNIIVMTNYPPKGEILSIAQIQHLQLKSVAKVEKKIHGPTTEEKTVHKVIGITPENVKEYFISSKHNHDKIKTLTEELSSEVDNTGLPNLHHTMKLVELLRLESFEEIQELYNSFHNDITKRTFLNFIEMTGTESSILFLIKEVKQGKITGERAANLVSNIAAYLMEPKPEIFDALWELSTENAVKKNRQLYVTTLLAFAEVFHQTCAPDGGSKIVKPLQTPIINCSSAIIAQNEQKLYRLFEQSSEDWERIAYATAIMRLGLNTTIDYVGPLLKTTTFYNYSQRVRTFLMMGLYYTGAGRAADLAHYLLPVYYNRSLSTEERLLAMELLVFTTTSQKILNQIALSTWDEPDPEVHSYVYSFLSAYVNLPDSCWENAGERSRSALRLAKPIKTGLLNSRFKIFYDYAEKWGMGSINGFATYFTARESAPQLFYYINAYELAGHYQLTNLEVFFTSEGLQKAVDYLIGPQSYYPNNFDLQDLFKPDKSNPKYKHENLNINSRDYIPASAYLSITHLINRYRLFFFDEHTLEDLIQSEILPAAKDLTNAYKHGFALDFHKFALLEDQKTKFHSAIGIPMTLESGAPLYLDVRGNISLNLKNLDVFSIKSNLRATLKFDFWYGVHADIPFTNSKIGLFPTYSIEATLPLNGYLNVDLPHSTIAVGQHQASSTPSKQPVPFFKLEAEPILCIHHNETSSTNNILKIETEHTTILKLTFGNFARPVTVISNIDLSLQKEAEFKHDNYQRSLLNLITFWRTSPIAAYRLFEVAPAAINWEANQVELNFTWSAHETTYQKELWKGKSVWERIRIFNMIPEWMNLLFPCNKANDPKRGPPKARTFLNRMKYRGRSKRESDPNTDNVIITDDFKESSFFEIIASFKTLGKSRSEIKTTINVKNKMPIGKTEISVVADLDNLATFLPTAKICFDMDIPSQLNTWPDKLKPDGFNMDAQVSWGSDNCDDNNFMELSSTIRFGSRGSEKLAQFKYQCNTPSSYFMNEDCFTQYQNMVYDQEEYNFTYSQNVAPLIQTLFNQWQLRDSHINQNLAQFLPVAVGPENKYRFTVNYKEHEPLLDLHINTGKNIQMYSNINYQSISPVLFPLAPYKSYIYRLINSITQNNYFKTCLIKANKGKITTFNGLEHNFTSDGCEYVITKDCSPSRLFTLTASGSNHKFQSMTIYLLNHKISFHPADLEHTAAGFKFQFDGRDQELEEGQTAILKSHENKDYFLAAVTLDSSKLVVKSPLMGFSFLIKSDFQKLVLLRSWKGKVCGLCGELTDQPNLTFIGPDQKIIRDPSAFSSSYRVNSANCKLTNS